MQTTHTSAEKIRGPAAVARDILKRRPVVFDTETTGLGDTDQIIEICIIDVDGKTLFESLVRPTVPVGAKAEEVHGLGEQKLRFAPSWGISSPPVRNILEGRQVVAFNSAFDLRLLEQTCKAHGQDTSWISRLETHCAMYLSADRWGATNQYGSISLANAMRAAGVSWRGEAHSASGDARATLDVLKAIAWGD
jgi:DNA polymerase III epsilon subunit-like protein